MQPFFGRFSGWPQVSAQLWATLSLGMLAGVNLIFKAEVWPHTPLAGAFWKRTLWVALVLAGPQLWLCGWRWLRGYQGPGGLRLALTAGYPGRQCAGAAAVVGGAGRRPVWAGLAVRSGWQGVEGQLPPPFDVGRQKGSVSRR